MEENYKVYCHTNKITGKKYIGITKLNPKRRWSNGKGYKECSVFYNAIKKYGWDGFSHEILFTGLTLDEAEEKEIELISKWDTLSPNGYNLQTGGGVNRTFAKETLEKMSKSQTGKKLSKKHIENIKKAITGLKRSPETVERIRQSQLGKTLTKEHKKNISLGLKRNKNRKLANKPILQLSLDGEFIREWDSASVASRELGLCRRGIGKCCTGEQNTSGGFKWRFKNA